MMSKQDSHMARAYLKKRFGCWSIAGVPLGKEADAINDGVALLILSTCDLIDAHTGDSNVFRYRAEKVFSSLSDVMALQKDLKTYVNLWRNIESSTVQDFVSEISEESVLWPILPCVVEYSTTRSVFAFQIVHHYLSFLGKMPSNNPSLREEAIAAYLFQETRLSSLVLNDRYVDDLKLIVSEWFSDFRPTGLPDHGPGSTADAGPSLQEKFSALGWDELFLLAPEWNSWFGPDATRSFLRRSKVILVPKTSLSLRTISEEPATLQYWQKPVQLGFDRIFRTTEMKYHIDLHDQEISRSFALRASATGLYSTLDLSAASDSVSLTLVERIFPWDVLRFLIATRSSETELPDGQIVALKKFAPMGSSVCFPLECTVFCAMCEVVARRHRLSDVERRNAYTVYGDDIIVRNDLVSDLLLILGSCGFLINESKSFTRNTFRESCGLYAFKGVDITTPQIPRDHESLRAPIRPDSIERMTDLCNQFLLSGMFAARLYVLYHLPDDLPFCLFRPEFLDVDRTRSSRCKRKVYSQRGIWTFWPTDNYRLRRRSSPPKRVPFPSLCPPHGLYLPGPVKHDPVDYQRRQFLILTSVSEGVTARYSDECRYDAWLRSSWNRSGSRDVISVPLGREPKRRMRKVWQYL